MPPPTPNGHGNGWLEQIRADIRAIFQILHWHEQQIDKIQERQIPPAPPVAGQLAQWKELFVAVASVAPALRWILGIMIIAGLISHRIDIGSIPVLKSLTGP